MNVTQLWRYPVKSMIGETVDAVDVDDFGVVGDRMWAVRDLERGGIRGAKKIGSLMQFAAHDLGDGDVDITLPDGAVVRTNDADLDKRISEALDHPVRLERLRPASDAEHFRRGQPESDDMMVELRGIFGREDDEPLPDFSVFPPELVEFESPPGAYHDAFPLLVMTEAALSSLAKALPDSAIDVRRFRPSIMIGTPGEEGVGAGLGHPEFDWIGRTARIGSAVVTFNAACPRCVMVTREIDDSLPVDRGVLRHIVRELDQNVGVYGIITTPGVIRVGDPLEFI